MSVTTLSLLGMPSEQALKVIVQELSNPGVSVNDLAIDKPFVESGNEMSVRVGVAGSAYERDDFPYFGAVTVNYKRLDLTDVFGPLNLEFDFTFPLITSHIVEKMTEALGVVFSEEDYVEELIESDDPQVSYTLKAAPNSPRWMGSVAIQLYRAG